MTRQIFGTDKADVLHGSQGTDFIFGYAGSDELFGGQGDDYLYGGQGNDQLYGGRGADNMFGSVGNDVIHFFNDQLPPPNGVAAKADVAYGGVGNDTFVFNVSPYQQLQGSIMDFNKGDKIDLTAYHATSQGIIISDPIHNQDGSLEQTI